MATELTDLSPQEIAAQNVRLNAWMLDYKFALGELADKPDSTLEQFVDVAWEKGILDHVSPTDPELRDMRKRRGRTLWQPRTDPVLYWRLQYAMEHLRATIGHTGTVGAHIVALVELLKVLGQLPKERRHAFFPKLKHHSGWPWMERVCTLLSEKARQALRDLGVTPHEPTLRRRSTGFFRGIPCQISSICHDGTLYLAPTDLGPQNAHLLKLLELKEELTPDGAGICPSLIVASAFTLPKRKR